MGRPGRAWTPRSWFLNSFMALVMAMDGCSVEVYAGCAFTPGPDAEPVAEVGQDDGFFEPHDLLCDPDVGQFACLHQVFYRSRGNSEEACDPELIEKVGKDG